MSDDSDISRALLVLGRAVPRDSGYRVFDYEDPAGIPGERICLIVGRGATATRMSDVAHGVIRGSGNGNGKAAELK